MVNEPTSSFPEVPGGSSGSGGWLPHGGQPPGSTQAPGTWDPTSGDPASHGAAPAETGPAENPPATLNGLGGPPAEAAPPRKLTGWLPMALGILGIVLGTLWTLQGLDILSGSKMSGSQWATIIGPVIAVVGLVLVILGERLRSRSKRKN